MPAVHGREQAAQGRPGIFVSRSGLLGLLPWSLRHTGFVRQERDSNVPFFFGPVFFGQAQYGGDRSLCSSVWRASMRQDENSRKQVGRLCLPGVSEPAAGVLTRYYRSPADGEQLYSGMVRLVVCRSRGQRQHAQGRAEVADRRAVCCSLAHAAGTAAPFSYPVLH